MSLLLNRAPPVLHRAFMHPKSSIPQAPITENGAYSSKASRKSRDGEQEPIQPPKFSLDGLGATPGIKAVIYCAIGVMGIAETYTYSLWAYHKLYPEPVTQGRDAVDVDQR